MDSSQEKLKSSRFSQLRQSNFKYYYSKQGPFQATTHLGAMDKANIITSADCFNSTAGSQFRVKTSLPQNATSRIKILKLQMNNNQNRLKSLHAINHRASSFCCGDSRDDQDSDRIQTANIWKRFFDRSKCVWTTPNSQMHVISSGKEK